MDEAILNGARGIVRKEEPAERLLLAIEKVVMGEFWLDREATGRMFDAFMLRDAHATREKQKLGLLTEKEKKVIKAVLEDAAASNKLLAQKLFISEHTLRNHLSSIYQKLEVENRMSLYMYATKHCKEEDGT